VCISSSHHTTHTLILSQFHATRLPAGHRKPPISAIPIVPRPPPSSESQQPSFTRLSKLLHFSPRTNALRPGRKDQSRDPLDVCFLLFFSHLKFTYNSRCSSLLHCPYLPIAFEEKVLHRLPCLVATPFSIPLRPRQARESKRYANRSDNP